MYTINEISIEHISRLDESELNKLLKTLLNSEASVYNLKSCHISVPENEKSKDGGIDGKIVWNGNPASTPHLFKTNIAFQNKATDLTPKKCFDEILLPLIDGEPRKLKPEIEKIVDANGGYVLFTTQPNTDQMNNQRVDQFRNAIKAAGKTNFAKLDIRVYDANFIVDWVNQHASAVDLVQGFSSITKPSGFRNWNTIALDLKIDDVAYQIDTLVSANIQAIRDNILAQKVIRIQGHSGIGKTRMVLEAFRPNTPQAELLNAQFVYCNVGILGQYDKLHNYIISHRLTQQGIIVVDNCDVEKHNELSCLIKAQGEFRLITMGYDDSKSITNVKIKLDRENQRDLVRQIVQQQIGSTHLPQDVDYVTRLCEGYPWMAVRYCEIINRDGISKFDKFFEDEAIEKLVFGLKPVDKIELHVLRACSVFSAFGFVDDSFASIINASYRDTLLAQTEFIRTKICDEPISPSRFTEICHKFKDEDIIERRGVYYIVKPTVLAIQLAAKWLAITSFDKIKEIIEDLKTVNLEQKFLDRLTDLDQLDKAKDIVEELFGMSSSFGSAEVLKTEWGSLLFRYVVEVNPDATCAALINAFKDWTKQDLFGLIEGRRNLVWALEKLCFHRETFYESTKFLFRLAISENETWANNATGQLPQLFQRFLAGTEADYNERLGILNWALHQNEQHYTQLAITCMGRAFLPQGQHSRSGGAENQGSGKPLVDFVPKTRDEIFFYWKSILNLLLPLINDNREYSIQGLKVLSRSVRTLLTENASDMLMECLRAVDNRGQEAWIEVRAELQKALKYDNIVGVLKGEIEVLLDEFQPKSIKEKFLSTVILPEWDYDPPVYIDGIRKDKQQKQAEDFAIYLLNEKIDWNVELPLLLVGEQRQTFNFGKKLGELSKNAKQLVYESSHILANIDRDKQNPGFLMGLISGINNPDFYVEMLGAFLKNQKLSHNALQLANLYPFNLDCLLDLIFLVDSGEFPITIFGQFKFGKPLGYLSADDFETFIDRIASYGIEGIATAFSIVFMHCFQNEPGWQSYKGKLKQLILAENLLLVKGRNLEPFYWSSTVVKLLKTNVEQKFVKIIVSQLAEFCDYKNFHYGYDSYLPEVFDILFERYFDAAWPQIGEKLNQNYLTIMHVKSMVGAKNGNRAVEGVLFNHAENFQKIYDWATINDKGKLAIANMMPFATIPKGKKTDQEEETPGLSIHPFAKGFIDRFGHSEKVLDEIAANLGTFSMVGGAEWYYKMLMDLVSQLFNHPIREVKTWAKKAFVHFEKNLKIESLDNQNREIE